jgi:two-component system OmpR family response regulator
MATMTSERSQHLLVVDDDREIRDLVSRFLTRHGYRVTAARDGREMKQALKDWSVDLIVLDLMLPGTDGLTLCRELRASSKIPVIMLTAMGEELDRIVGLEMGADDYLPKPFNPRELLARIKAVLRRIDQPSRVPDEARSNLIRFEDWEFDAATRVLKGADGVAVDLTAGEFELLQTFVLHPQRVLNRDQILDMTRGRSAVPFDRSVDVQVGRLRRKIEADPANPLLIKTVRGGGYIFTPSVERT